MHTLMRWLLAVALAATALLIGGGIVLMVASLPLPVGLMDWGFPGFQAVGAVVYAGIGALIAKRHPANPVGWLLLIGVGLIGSAVQAFVHYYAIYGVIVAPGSLPLPEIGLWIESWIWVPGVGSIVFALLFFPNGRLPTPRWRPVVWVGVLGATLATLGFATTNLAGVLTSSEAWTIVSEGPLTGIAVSVGMLLFLVALVAASVSLVLRFRRAVGIERQQLKWLAVSATLVALAFVVAMGPLVVLGEDTPASAILAVTFLTIPAAMGIAILRHRLFDIDLVINRTLVYGALSLTLASVYIGLVIVLQGVLSGFTGGGSLAVATSTLVVAAAFQPLRRRIQASVDRRFYRSRYNAQRTVEAFSAKLRDEVDLEQLTGDLREVVEETLRPTSVSVWIRRGPVGS
jgi:hypothetical protein